MAESVHREHTDQTPATTLLDLLTTIAKYRKFITWFVLVVTGVTTIVSFLLPKWYKSSASVFPAERADLFAGLEGAASLVRSFVPGGALSSLTGNPELDRYLAILKSSTVLNDVIRKFDLVRVYDITSYPREKTAKELLSNVEFIVEDEGNLSIEVYDKDPQRAANMANYFVEMLNRTNTELQVQNARGNRQFIEARYKQNLKDLAAAEDSLKAFAKTYGIIALPEQMEASITAAAEIMGQLALKEVERGVLRRTISASHPSVRAAEIEISELQKKLSQMTTGTGKIGEEPSIFLPFSRIPDIGSEYIRLFREIEIQTKILEFITPLYEQAKVEEKRQTPSVLILDKAGPAERKAKPKRLLYALLSFVISLLVALVAVFTREGLLRLKQSDPARYDSTLSSIRSDWFGLRIRRKPR